MKGFILSFFLLVSVPSFATSLNVKDYGAKGDGVTDDTAAVNRALAAMATQKASLNFPAGTYLCNQVDSSGNILTLNAGGLSSVTLGGAGGNQSIIKTSVSTNSTLLYIYAYAPSMGLRVYGMEFMSTHTPSTPFWENGIFLQGTAGTDLQNTVIGWSTFSGFGNAIGAQGVNNLDISYNSFVSPQGHDASKNDGSPAVYVWMYDNSNGNCQNVRILNNTANGYTGTAPVTSLVSKRAMDGFVYGTAYGLTILNNGTTNFSQEHYAIAPPSTNPLTTQRISILANNINGAIPSGSLNADGSAMVGNYGIRCDASHALIADNTITNFTTGIMVRTTEYPTVTSSDIQILNNTLTGAADSAHYNVSVGITAQGTTGHLLSQLSIIQNSVNANALKNPAGYSGIRLNYTADALVSNNGLQQLMAVSPASFAIAYGSLVNACQQSNFFSANESRQSVGTGDAVQMLMDY